MQFMDFGIDFISGQLLLPAKYARILSDLYEVKTKSLDFVTKKSNQLIVRLTFTLVSTV